MKRKICCYIMTIIICLFSIMLFGCEKDLPEYYYNSKGEYVAYLNNDFLYDKSTNEAIAKYDSEKKVFYNNSGYYGEIYKDKYLVYNNNSPYLNSSFASMPIAPKAPMKPSQANIKAIALPSGIRDCNINTNTNTQSEAITQLNINNYNNFISVSSNIDGYAAFYVYVNTSLVMKSNFTIYTPITVNCTLNITYKGYLKTDYTQSKLFTKKVNFSVNSNGLKRQSLYDLDHKYYGFYEEVSSSIIVTSVQGAIIKN